MIAYLHITEHEIAEYLNAARPSIYEDWCDRLRKCLGAKAVLLLEELDAQHRAGEDLFTVLLDSLKMGRSVQTTSTPDRMYRKSRSLGHWLFAELKESACLEQCLEHFLSSSDGWTDLQKLSSCAIVRQKLNALSGYVYREATEVFSHIAQYSKTAFCRTDPEGRIVYANREMERLCEEPSVSGKRLSDYFTQDDGAFVSGAVLNKNPTTPDITRLTLRSAKDRQIAVGAEIGSVVIDGRYQGGYAFITDISLAERQRNQIYERSLLGIVQLNLRGDILYANKSMLDMLQLESYEKVSVFDFLDDKSKRLVQAQLDSRSDGESDEYPLDLKRKKSEVPIPVTVSAFPQTDLSGRNIIGSFAIVRSSVARRMHYHIESHHPDEKELLRAVMEELKIIIPYDLVTVSKYSFDQKYACAIFSHNEKRAYQFNRRWFELSPAHIQWNRQKEPQRIEDIEAFLNQPQWRDLKNDSDVQALLQAGYRSAIRYPIFRDDRLVASVSLMSKSKDAFKDHHLRHLKNLPIQSAVHVALHYHEGKEKALVSDLILNLTTAGSDIHAIAGLLVAAVAAHFERQSVALFKVNKKEGVIELIDQAYTAPKFKIDEGRRQSLHQGVLGHVSRHGTMENIGYLQEDERFKEIHLSPTAEARMQSELCIPIPFGGSLWLLNIEDEQINAFSQEEVDELRRVLDEVRGYLEKTWLSRFLETFLSSTADAVLVIDMQGRIVQVNPAAGKILPTPTHQGSCGPGMMQPSAGTLFPIDPMALRDIFVDPEEADQTIATGHAPMTAVELKGRSGDILPVVLTVVDLREDFGHAIYIATDLTAQCKLKEFEHLEKIYHELAIQTKTPLALAAGWIGRMKPGISDSQLRNGVDKTLRQLRKLEITFNRLALYADQGVSIPYNRVLLDANEMMTSIQRTLPDSEQSRIAWNVPKDDSLIRGDLFHLCFCMETILACLLRFVPEEGRIVIDAVPDAHSINISINGWLPKPEHLSDCHGPDRQRLSETLADLSMGRRLIDQIVREGHGGRFTESWRDGGQATFNITLPRWQGDRHAA